MSGPAHSEPPERSRLTWRWAAAALTTFLGIFVGAIVGSTPLETICLILFAVCVLHAMGLTERRTRD
jgi:hypothetical protein